MPACKRPRLPPPRPPKPPCLFCTVPEPRYASCQATTRRHTPIAAGYLVWTWRSTERRCRLDECISCDPARPVYQTHSVATVEKSRRHTEQLGRRHDGHFHLAAIRRQSPELLARDSLSHVARHSRRPRPQVNTRHRPCKEVAESVRRVSKLLKPPLSENIT